MWPFKRKTLEQHLYGAKKIKVNGVVFVIRKINAMDHLAGLNVLQKIHEVYKVNKANQNAGTAAEHLNKLRNYCRDILLAGVVVPKLSATDNGDGFFVDRLFFDFPMAQRLTEEILFHTYKKKLPVKTSTSNQG